MAAPASTAWRDAVAISSGVTGRCGDIVGVWIPPVGAQVMMMGFLNVSTGGGLGMTREERLRAAVATSPEMASLNVASLNFGIFPLGEKYAQWKHDWEPAFLEMTRDFIFRNSFADIEYIVKELGHGHGTRFEFECYDLGHLYNLAWVIDQGWLEPPYFVQMVFGVLG